MLAVGEVGVWAGHQRSAAGHAGVITALSQQGGGPQMRRAQPNFRSGGALEAFKDGTGSRASGGVRVTCQTVPLGHGN